jgi:sporulation protein YlmC with PRC-barrel domain
MQIEITSLYNLEVYTQKGLYLGRISEILVDMNKYAVYELILSETNPNIVEESRSIGIPYRWIKSISEIVVLKYFPGKIHIKGKLQRYRQKRRKLRVLKKRGAHGISRMPWSAPRSSRR